MNLLATTAAAFALIMTALHLVTTHLALRRCRQPKRGRFAGQRRREPVSIVRPMCGIDAHEEETLRSAFRLEHDEFELIFCVASPSDPVIPLIERVMREYPGVRAELLIGDDRISDNPKLNNIVKGWRRARHEWVVIVDSNVLLPPDYLARLFEAWTPGTGLVSAPPAGAAPSGLAAELECAFLNGYQARWQYAADSTGFGFAQGKNLFWRRADLERFGGITALASDKAEDAASTKLVRSHGLKVRLVDCPFPQLLGRRTFASVWSRQLRWSRLRYQSFAPLHLLEVTTGMVLPIAAALFAAPQFDLPVLGVLVAMLVLWLGPEARLNSAAGWHLNWRAPFLWIARDLLLPALWLVSMLGTRTTWRGNEIRMPSVLDPQRTDAA